MESNYRRTLIISSCVTKMEGSNFCKHLSVRISLAGITIHLVAEGGFNTCSKEQPDTLNLCREQGPSTQTPSGAQAWVALFTGIYHCHGAMLLKSLIDLPFMGIFLEIVEVGIICFPSNPSQARKQLTECFPSLEKKWFGLTLSSETWIGFQK